MSKPRSCPNFAAPGGCRLGPRCTNAHGFHELRPFAYMQCESSALSDLGVTSLRDLVRLASDPAPWELTGTRRAH